MLPDSKDSNLPKRISVTVTLAQKYQLLLRPSKGTHSSFSSIIVITSEIVWIKLRTKFGSVHRNYKSHENRITKRTEVFQPIGTSRCNFHTVHHGSQHQRLLIYKHLAFLSLTFKEWITKSPQITLLCIRQEEPSCAAICMKMCISLAVVFLRPKALLFIVSWK